MEDRQDVTVATGRRAAPRLAGCLKLGCVALAMIMLATGCNLYENRQIAVSARRGPLHLHRRSGQRPDEARLRWELQPERAVHGQRHAVTQGAQWAHPAELVVGRLDYARAG